MNDDYWHAVAMLRLDRRQGLPELARVFGRGMAPREIGGPLRGRLVATTVGHGSDVVFEALANAWLPWRGKSFAPAQADGLNLFTRGGDRAISLAFPRYHGRSSDGTERTAFRFVTSVGASQTHPDTDVLRIDYRDLAENPAWPVRRVLDELVQVEDDLFLGQALMHWRGELRRAAWFSLER
jgi:hypothetical protein